MHYYKRNLGDYAKKTGRLSMLQHGAYTLLIDACYDRERFPTLEEAIEWTWASTKEEMEAVEFVLRRFFTMEDGSFVQKRIQEEIAEYHEKAETNKRIATEREAKRKAKTTEGERTVHEPSPTVNEAPPNHKPITNNQEPQEKNTGASAKRAKPAVSQPEGVSETVWLDFVAMRKAKRAPLTQTALDGIAREAAKAGLTLEKALAECCSRGWQGFKADWMAPKLVGHGVQVDIARMTTPGPVGPDPTLEKLRRDRLNAVPPSAEIRQKLAELKRGGAV